MNKVGIRFDIQDDAGALSGRTYFQDQGTDEYAPEALLSGSCDGGLASWTTESGAIIKGRFDGSSFVGTMEFPPDEGRPVHAGKLVLNK